MSSTGIQICIYKSKIPCYSSGVRMPPCNNPQKTDEKSFCKKQLFCKLCEFISVKQSPSPVKISNKEPSIHFPLPSWFGGKFV